MINSTLLNLSTLASGLLEWIANAACVVILYFLAAACFYQGSWRDVGISAIVAILCYLVSVSFDAFCEKLYKNNNSETLVSTKRNTGAIGAH